ncbi:MAG: hypothetical protein HYU53_02060 [Acidobacteria bacterium]|nr:hypothetical protein [Acidobacteriota bacterium]
MDRPDEGVAAARAELLSNLSALRQAVLATATLATVLDSGWFDAVEAEINRTSPPRPSTTDPSGFLYDFCHPLRGVDWFEKAQQLAFDGRRSEIGDDSKFALAFAGLDPLRTIVPSLDARLQAFSSLTFKPETVRVKLAELRAARQNTSFKNHLFELSVMGDLALKKALTDIEDPATAVDGVINVDGRDILVEATKVFTRNRNLPTREDRRVRCDFTDRVVQALSRCRLRKRWAGAFPRRRLSERSRDRLPALTRSYSARNGTPLLDYVPDTSLIKVARHQRLSHDSHSAPLSIRASSRQAARFAVAMSAGRSSETV